MRNEKYRIVEVVLPSFRTPTSDKLLNDDYLNNQFEQYMLDVKRNSVVFGLEFGYSGPGSINNALNPQDTTTNGILSRIVNPKYSIKINYCEDGDKVYIVITGSDVKASQHIHDLASKLF